MGQLLCQFLKFCSIDCKLSINPNPIGLFWGLESIGGGGGGEFWPLPPSDLGN